MRRQANLLLIPFLSFLFLLPSCNGADRLWQHCSEDNKTTPTTSANIAHVLRSVVTKASSEGFATDSAGTSGSSAGERVYGLAQCRGDVGDGDCASCLSAAAAQLPQLCRGQTDGRIWFDYCFLRYSTEDFVGVLDTGLALFYINTANVTQNGAELQRFEVELGNLMRKVQAQAAAPANKGLGKGQIQFTPFVTIYALGQCTRDLAPLPCAQCIAIAVAAIPDFCRYRKGCRALYSSCYVRYEIYPFFFPLDPTRRSTEQGTFTTAVAHSD